MTGPAWSLSFLEAGREADERVEDQQGGAGLLDGCAQLAAAFGGANVEAAADAEPHALPGELGQVRALMQNSSAVLGVDDDDLAGPHAHPAELLGAVGDCGTGGDREQALSDPERPAEDGHGSAGEKRFAQPRDWLRVGVEEVCDRQPFDLAAHGFGPPNASRLGMRSTWPRAVPGGRSCIVRSIRHQSS